jgi:integrase/recombinase XerD
MQEVTIYQGEASLIIAEDAMQIDAAFLVTWLHGKSEKTQRAYSADIHKFYAHVGKLLHQVTLADVQSFEDSLASLKPTSRARTIAAVKSCLSFAVKTGYLQLNVGAAVKLPRVENTLAERIMSEQAVARLLALESNPRNHAILVLLYRGGLRAQEVCNLQWRHLQPREESGQVAIHGKGEKTRHILLDIDDFSDCERGRQACKDRGQCFTSLDAPCSRYAQP